MEIIDNINRLLGDSLKSTVKPGAKLQIAACFAPDLDEDISVANLLAGQRSSESQASLKKWLTAREGKKPSPVAAKA